MALKPVAALNLKVDASMLFKQIQENAQSYPARPGTHSTMAIFMLLGLSKLYLLSNIPWGRILSNMKWIENKNNML